MEDFRKKFINQYLKEIDEKWDHLNYKERQDLVYLRNQKDKMKPGDFNKLKALAESVRPKI